MKLLVIGAGMMGTSAAYDMARNGNVTVVTIADTDKKRAKQSAERVNKLAKRKIATAVELDASEPKKAARLMGNHDAALSAVPYFFNLGLAKAAIDARCHFADLGGNNTVVREELALSKQAEKRGVLDVDAPEPDRFDDRDRAGLERFVQTLEPRVAWAALLEPR